MQDRNIRDQIDLLRHIENLTENINNEMNLRSRSVLKRYPLTFALLGLFGVVAVGEGIKGLLESISLFNDNPHYLLLLGLIILIIIGSLYRKLDKQG